MPGLLYPAMLMLDLPRLEREGRLSVEADVPSDDPLWQGSDLRFEGPVSVRLDAHEAGSGEVIVRGRVRGVLLEECRRCLSPIRRPLNQELIVVYTPVDELADGEYESDVRELPYDIVELNLGDAVREELMLDVDRYVVCRPDCRGLCPVCGVNLNEDTCECSLDEPDPRWDALRALNKE